MKIVYILPSRSRPVAFLDTMDNIIEYSTSDDYEVIGVLDEDDKSMNKDSVKSYLSGYSKLKVYWGTSKSKVEAINREVDKIPSDASIVILISDDQKFIIKGFDEIIRKDFKKYFPDFDGVLHYPDGTPQRLRLITMSILGKKYFDRFGYLYNPAYTSVFADDEFTSVAKRLKKYKFIDMQIFQHFHWLWRTAEKDALYERNDDVKNYLSDGEIFRKRKEINFGL